VSFGSFLGVGVSEAGNGSLGALDWAIPDVTEFAGLLGDAFDCEILVDPAEQKVRDRLQELAAGTLTGGPLVVMWCGHALGSAADHLRLLARNSVARPSAGLGISDLVAPCAESGANQLLFVIDTCFAGKAMGTAEVVAAFLRNSPPGGHVWVGVLASCLDAETARDGLFGHRLREVLAHGPRTPELKVRWSAHSKWVRGDDVCDALIKDWDGGGQTPDFLGHGSAWWMFPNPLFSANAPEQVVEHLLQAARSGAPLDQRSWFTGRTQEVNQVAGWVRARQPGIYVITGSAGTGKSAIAGRVVSLSNPAERERLLRDGHGWAHADPGKESVHAHLHARGLTADRAAAVLADQLVSHDALPPQTEPRNASELAGQVQRALEGGSAPPVLVVDGLDEARADAFGIAEDLLSRLAPYAVIVVSTRELRRGGDQPSLLAALGTGGARLDLDDLAAQERTRADLATYISERLAGADARMDAGAVAAHLTSETSMTADRPFLLARLVADQLRAVPVDTSVPGWEDKVSSSIEEAFDTDLDGVDRPPHRDDRSGSELARSLLTALTWGYGAGFPEEEWLVTASALHAGAGFGREDVLWVLNQLGRYILQDGEAGVAVYRIAHQSLADHLRAPFRGSHEQPFNPHAVPVTKALAARYRNLLAGGITATAPVYLRRYLWGHAADSGTTGLDILRDLAGTCDDLRPDVAMAAGPISERLRHWGHHIDALPYAEEATRLYRELAQANPAFLPDLAMALNNLGAFYSEVGRRDEAVAPTEEATRLYRELAQANPAFLPNLAAALNNLGNRCTKIGAPERGEDAWRETLIAFPGESGAYLLALRVAAAGPGHPDAMRWLVTALGQAPKDRGLLAGIHSQARRHRAADPVGFSTSWQERTGEPAPAWLTVDPGLLATAEAWVATGTYQAECDFLAGHGELLDPSADVAVEEALLGVGEQAAERYTSLREAARIEGVAAAYRPLLLSLLAGEFMSADLDDQRILLANRRDDLLSDTVREVIESVARKSDEVTAHRAAALLDLVTAREHEAVLDALAEPVQLPPLLHDLACGPEPAVLAAAATAGLTFPLTAEQAGTVLFYLAVAAVRAGNLDGANEMAGEARRLTPGQEGRWIDLLADIGQHHASVLPLIKVLNQPLPEPGDAADASEGEGGG
jgi:tetratricopeptide (TPR) repeat protein